MGATNIVVASFGKSVSEAYNKAVQEANDQYGHQDGYSGAINSSRGYTLVTLPSGITVKDWINYIEEFDEDGENTHIPENVRKSYLSTIKRHWDIYDDKWGPMLAMELHGEELEAMLKRNKLENTKVFIFAGFVPE